MSIPRVNSNASELNDFDISPEGKMEYHVSKSRLIKLINWVYVFQLYTPVVTLALSVIVVVQIFIKFGVHDFNVQRLLASDAFRFQDIVEGWRDPNKFSFSLPWQVVLTVALIIWNFSRKNAPVYLLDFATFEPPKEWRITQEETIRLLQDQPCFTRESIEFMERMLKQSGVGEATAWPPGVTKCKAGGKYDSSIEASREEAEIIMFDVVRRALEKTKMHPKDIDVLIVNCSLFSPTPSLCAMIINGFKMRQDISTYNLSGMGCSAGLVSIELAKNILSGRPNINVLVVSTEIITPNLYLGNERSFLLQNILFRCGGAAIILSNKWTDAFRAKFKLLHVVRTQYVSDDSAGCVYETQDENLVRGVRLSKDLVKVAGRAMEKNFTMLGPLVLSVSEQSKTVFWMIAREVCKRLNATFGTKLPKVSPYIPDFKRGIDHFCIHAGGRGVIDGIEKNLQLAPYHVEASRHTLYHYGNTSSSSIWYEMKYACENMNLKRGQRVLQLAFGSGFKCNTAVWLSLRSFEPRKNDKTKKE
jgi:3-ketoacyl-CoA synthase